MGLLLMGSKVFEHCFIAGVLRSLVWFVGFEHGSYRWALLSLNEVSLSAFAKFEYSSH